MDDNVSYSGSGDDGDGAKGDGGEGSDDDFFSGEDLKEMKLGEDDDDEASFNSDGEPEIDMNDAGSDYGDEYDQEMEEENEAKDKKKKKKDSQPTFASYDDFAHLLEEGAQKTEKKTKAAKEEKPKRTFSQFELA